MLKRIFLMSLLVLVGNLAITPSAFASTNSDKEAKFAEKVKTEIAKLGVGKDSKVKVKLKDGTKLKGYISDIDEDGFSITDAKTGRTTAVTYSNAKQIRGNNLSKQVIIGIVIFVAIIGLVVIAGLSAK